MSAAIFSGGYAKILANLGIKLKDDTRILSGSVDPSVTNPSAPDGSIYLSSGFGLFVRKSSTWLKLASSEELVNSLLIQTFEEAALADFTQTGLELIASPFIHGKKTARLIHQAASNYSFKQVKPVDPKFRGKSNTFRMDCRSTADSANVTVLIKDETNNATLVSGTFTTGRVAAAVFNTNSNTTINVTDNAILNSLKVGASISGAGIPTGTTITAVNSTAGTITISNAATATATGVSLKVSALPNVQSYAFDIPTNCSSISYTVTALQEAGLPETYVDDIVIELTDMAMTSTSVTVPTIIEQSSFLDTSSAIGNVVVSGALTESKGSGIYSYNSGTGIYTLLKDATVNISASFKNSAGASPEFYVRKNSTILVSETTTPTTGYTGALSAEYSFVAGDTFDVSNGSTNTSNRTRIVVTATAYSTETKTIPLSSSVIVTEPDSSVRVNTANGYGSTGTSTRRFSSVLSSLGSDIRYISDSVNGDSFTILTAGVYSINYTDTFNTSSALGITVNASSSTLVTSLPVANVLHLVTTAAANYANEASYTGYFNAGDVIRAQTNAAPTGATASQTYFTISKQGSTKILNPSSDQKVEIPTHELRFEGASARGSVATAIIKFDTLAKIKGDGFEVVNTAADGTVVTIKKAGRLTVGASINASAAAQGFYLTKNQAVLNSISLSNAEILNGNGGVGATGLPFTGSWSGDVEVGDKIRLASSANPTVTTTSSFNFSLQEKSVAVALQNVAPRWDDSDSAVRVQQTIGYGSTNSFVRRFANVLDNFGTSVTYSDSATLGSSFTINEDGEYFITYNDNFSSGSNVAIVKNGNGAVNTPSQTPSNVLSANAGATGGAFVSCSWQGKLQKGDIIRPHTDGGAVSSANYVSFTISKVGKTQGTVDVTPFVQIPSDAQVQARIQGTPTASYTLDTPVTFSVISYSDTDLGALNTSTGRLVSPIDGFIDVDYFFNTNVAINCGSYVAVNGLYRSYGGVTQSSTGFVTGSATVKVNKGDIVDVRCDKSWTVTAGTTSFIAFSYTKQSPSIATPTDQVSSDTIPFVFKATAITDSDPVGTFNTYTYAANTNTATISATAPTQSTSSMNINGVQVFARAHNVTSTAAQPARVDIKIGKGLSSCELLAYSGLAKVEGINFKNNIPNNAAEDYNTAVSYDGTTGILTINAGSSPSSITLRRVGARLSDYLTYSSAYFTFNASKSPSLVSIPNLQPRVATMYETLAAGVNSGGYTVNTWNTRGLTQLNDYSGVVKSLSANTFTLEAGTYEIDASIFAYFCGNISVRLRNTTDNTTTLTGMSGYGGASTVGANARIKDTFTITSQKSFQLQFFSDSLGNATISYAGATSAGMGEPSRPTIVSITKIK